MQALYFPTIVRPVEEGLALAAAAREVAPHAPARNLGYVADHRPPPLDLPFVILVPPAHVVPTVPLEPPARVVFVNPSLRLPHGEGLARVNLEEVEVRVFLSPRELRFREPVFRKFLGAVAHVHTVEDAEREHLFRRKLRPEVGVEVLSRELGAVVHVPPLHSIVHRHLLLHRGIVALLGFSIPYRNCFSKMDDTSIYIPAFYPTPECTII